MKYVILRDDDANATTPISKLEPLYRPFLERCLPVHLAIIPSVRMNVHRRDGFREGFLHGPAIEDAQERPIEDNPDLLDYLRHNPFYVPIVHGFNHAFVDGNFEFNRDEPKDIAKRLDAGLAIFESAGLGRPKTFVAPQDQCSRSSVVEITKRFRVLSLQYLNRHRLPRRYWPAYLWRKSMKSHRHFHLGSSTILTHPGCLLSAEKPIHNIFDNLRRSLENDEVTVIVSHHWEYFYPNGNLNAALVDVLHAFADYLAAAPDVQVIRMDEASRYIR